MEKIVIKSIVDTGRKTKDGNPVIEITTSDDRTGSGFDKTLLSYNVGQEVEVEVKKAPEYQGNERWYFMLPKPAGQQQGSKFPQKNWDFEKRKESLMRAIDACKLTETKVTTDNIISLAGKFYDYLNQKS